MKKTLIIALLAAVFLSSCGGNKIEKTEGIKEEKVVNTNENKDEHYPVTIKTYNSSGEEIETVYEKAPEKVLAVYQGSIETMLELGLYDKLVAAAGLDNEVPENQKSDFEKVKYLDEFTPSLETVTMLEPDMIFSWGSLFGEKTLGEVNDWLDKKVNIYMNTNTHSSSVKPYNRTLENEFNDILNIGKIFNVEEKAEKIVNEMKSIIDDVSKKTKENDKKQTVLILESTKDTFINYDNKSLGGDMVTKLGGELAIKDSSKLGKEDIISANPDVIFVVYMPYDGDDEEQVKQEKLDVYNDKAFSELNAVKNKRIIPIKLSEMYASATRTKDGIETFAKGLYPNLNEK